MEAYKIKIQFFEEKDQFKNAIKGGVYLIELLKEGIDDPIRLYVGESGAVIKRCGKHLYALFGNPSYLGLKREDLKKEDFILRISLVTPIKNEKKYYWDKEYKNKELEVIQQFNPITQLQTSDRQIKNKVEVVQNRMKELGFK
ncbi:MAG: hypothetical protein HDQ99_02715 [Lachnospiraceae bacterium]|nr:hypothetical protein [Lachnospiraceae bacterium]